MTADISNIHSVIVIGYVKQFYVLFLYSACFFLPQRGISLVYWLNSRRTVYYSPVDAWLGGAGAKYIGLFTAF